MSDAVLEGQPTVAEPLRRRLSKCGLEQAVCGQLDHSGKADAVRTDDGHRTIGIAHRRQAVTLAVVTLELAAIAAERDQYALALLDAQLRPIVAVEITRAAAVQSFGVGMAQVQSERLSVLDVLQGALVQTILGQAEARLRITVNGAPRPDG